MHPPTCRRRMRQRALRRRKRKRSPQRRRRRAAGSARSAATSTRAMSFRRISNARSASREQINLKKFSDPERRDALLRKKTLVLEKKFRRLFPSIPFKTEMAWCGTFSTTKDGLPFIGNCPDKDRMFFDLGYGGNGITFSMIGAQIICKKLQGIDDERGRIFGYERIEKYW